MLGTKLILWSYIYIYFTYTFDMFWYALFIRILFRESLLPYRGGSCFLYMFLLPTVSLLAKIIQADAYMRK